MFAKGRSIQHEASITRLMDASGYMYMNGVQNLFPGSSRSTKQVCFVVSGFQENHPPTRQYGNWGQWRAIGDCKVIIMFSWEAVKGRDSEVNLSGTVRKILWSVKLLVGEYSWVKNQWYINIGRQLRQGGADCTRI
jgi:hypothetical protein